MKTENETNKVTSSFLNTAAKSSVQSDVNSTPTSDGWTTVSKSEADIVGPQAKYNTATGHWYSLTATAKTWQLAEDEAVLAGGHLVTVNNLAEKDWLQVHFPVASDTSGNSGRWIGYTDSETVPGISASEGNWKWVDGTEPDGTTSPKGYENWRTPAEPNDNPAPEDYAAIENRSDITSLGNWNDVNGSVSRFGIIESSTNPDVQHYNGHSYILSTPTTWTAAEAQAVALGGHLVTVNDANEQTFLFNGTGGETGFTGFGVDKWIGFTDQVTEGTWAWADGTTPVYGAVTNGSPKGAAPWDNSPSPGEPNNNLAGGVNGEDFAVLSNATSGKWNDLSNNYLSSRPGIIEVTPTITLDLNGDTGIGNTDYTEQTPVSLFPVALIDAKSILDGNTSLSIIDKIEVKFNSLPSDFGVFGTARPDNSIATLTATSLPSGITLSYTTNGITLAGANKSNTDWQTALRAITYNDTSNHPDDPGTITVTATDIQGGAIGTDTHEVTIIKENDAPTFTGFPNSPVNTGYEDHEVAVSFEDLLLHSNAKDPDTGDKSGVVAFVVKSVATDSTLTIGGKPYVASVNNVIDAAHPAAWVPPLNANGVGDDNAPEAFTVVARDEGTDGHGYGYLESALPAVPVQINVTPVNDIPVGVDRTTPIVAVEDITYLFKDADFGFTDPNDTPVNSFDFVIIKTLPAASAGVLKLNGSTNVTEGQSISAASITNLTFVPTGEANGLSHFQFEVQDNGTADEHGVIVNTSISHNTMTLNVAAVADLPTVDASSVVATGNKSVGVAITFDDLKTKGHAADVDGVVTSFVVTAAPTNGTLTIGGSPYSGSGTINNTIDATHTAIWTSADTVTSGADVNAFKVVAKDNDTTPNSSSEMQVNVGIVSITGDGSTTPFAGTKGYEDAGAIILPFTKPTDAILPGDHLVMTLTGMPAGATLPTGGGHGHSNVGTWGLNPDAVNNMSFTPATDFNSGAAGFNLTVTSVVYTPDPDYPGEGHPSEQMLDLTFGTNGKKTQVAHVDVAPVNDAPTGTVNIDNIGNFASTLDNNVRGLDNAREGDTLEIKNTLADVDGMNNSAATVVYDWYRTQNGVTSADKIATGEAYTLVAADIDSQVSVKATYRDDGGFLTVVDAQDPVTSIVSRGNDSPVITITSGDSFTANLLESDSALHATGTLQATDLDDSYATPGTYDVVSVAVTASTPDFKTISSGSFPASLNDATLLKMLSIAPDPVLGTAATPRTAEFTWNFNSTPEAFNDLQKDQTLTLTYALQLKDARSGESNVQNVVINVTGTAENPALTVPHLPNKIVAHDTTFSTDDLSSKFSADDGSGELTFSYTAHKFLGGYSTEPAPWIGGGSSSFSAETGHFADLNPTLADAGLYAVTITATDTDHDTHSVPSDFYIYVDPTGLDGTYLVYSDGTGTKAAPWMLPSAADVIGNTSSLPYTVSYNESDSAVRVSLAKTTPQNTSWDWETLKGIDNIIGSDFDDILTGNNNDNIFEGALGKDTFIGGLGNDTYLINSSDDVISEKPDTIRGAAGGTDEVIATASYVLPANVENITIDRSADGINATGNNLPNILTGNDQDNRLDGKAGADSMVGGGGNDDVYVVDNAADSVTGNSAGTRETIESSVTLSLAATSITKVENLTLTGTQAINGTGTSGDNTITGNSVDNVLDGGVGGNDLLIGGAGNDTYIVNDTSDTITELTDGGTADLVKSSITWSLATGLSSDYLENLTLTGELAINATGNALDNILTGNSNANSISGGNGVDTLFGEAGNDALDGGAGSDSMVGGTGDDTYTVDASNVAVSGTGDSRVATVNLANGDKIKEIADGGADVVSSSVSYGLSSYVETLNLIAGTDGIGNSMVNYINGNTGDNWLDGKKGADIMFGGGGADTYYVDNIDDAITGGLGVDLAIASISYTIGDSVDNLTLAMGARVAREGTGNSFDNIITGNAYNNLLKGMAGDDVLSGGDGKDTLIGGTGADSLYGGSSTTTDAFADVFKYESVGDSTPSPLSQDSIGNFHNTGAEKDKIDLKAIDAKVTVSDMTASTYSNNAFIWIGNDAFSHVEGELRYEQSGSDTLVQGDVDGDGTADLQITLLIFTGLTLAKADFIL